MGKILVTGAAGRLGANLVKSLATDGHDVRAFVLPDDPKVSKLKDVEAEVFLGDLRDPDAVDKAFEGVERVAHLGYIMGRPKGMTRATEFDINIPGTFNMLESASKRVDDLDCFLFASTNATYDAFHAKYVPMDEIHPRNPTSFYGIAKVVGERLVEGYGLEFGLRWSVVRFGTVPGPDEILRHWSARQLMGYLRGLGNKPGTTLYVPGVKEPEKPVAQAIEDGYELVIPYNLEGKSWFQDIVDPRDTVQGITLALTKDEAIGEAFNVTAPWAARWSEAIPYLAEKTGKEYKELRIPNMWAFACDNSKAKRMLAYKPEYDVYAQIDLALAYQAGEDVGVFPA